MSTMYFVKKLMDEQLPKDTAPETIAELTSRLVIILSNDDNVIKFSQYNEKPTFYTIENNTAQLLGPHTTEQMKTMVSEHPLGTGKKSFTIDLLDQIGIDERITNVLMMDYMNGHVFMWLFVQFEGTHGK